MHAQESSDHDTYNPLSRYHTVGSLLKFSFPTLCMMVFSGLYTIVDTIFVSRLVNTDALSSINIVTPMINIIVGLGAMFATGASAIVARKQGEGKDIEARKDFTLIILTVLALGVIIALVGLFFLEPIIYALGANTVLLPYAKEYLSLLFVFAPANMLQVLFQSFLLRPEIPGSALS